MAVRKKISQVEARRLKKRVASLEAMFRNSYEGTTIATWTLNDPSIATVRTAKTLGYGLVLHSLPDYSGSNQVRVQAVKI